MFLLIMCVCVFLFFFFCYRGPLGRLDVSAKRLIYLKYYINKRKNVRSTELNKPKTNNVNKHRVERGRGGKGRNSEPGSASDIFVSLVNVIVGN